MNKTLEELKREADALGITYSGNIGAAKLAAKIEEWYAKENSTEDIETEFADAIDENIEETELSQTEHNKKIARSLAEAKRIIKEQERKNLETVIVKISMADKREASTATHAYFSTGDVSLNVPLDVFVEMPKILVYMAEEAKALVHVEQNGETVAKLQKKYIVEYKDREQQSKGK